jgi:hypothetical protein
MICIKCNHNNPATIGYCQKCGGKMDFTADQIEAALIDKKKDEVVQNTTYYAKQALTFAVVLLLLAVSLFFLAGGAPEDTYAIPSVSKPGKHVEIEHKLEVEMPKALVPLDAPK